MCGPGSKRLCCPKPVIKTLEQYDFKFATGAPRTLLTELSTLTFVERVENVVLLGRTGVGKTHFAVAVGYKVVQNDMKHGSAHSLGSPSAEEKKRSAV